MSGNGTLMLIEIGETHLQDHTHTQKKKPLWLYAFLEDQHSSAGL